jgi:anion-transporting  ArsA/GET3 family ATPase
MSDATRVCLVMNNDRLSFAEAFRIHKKLADIGMHIDSVVINKSLDHEIPDQVKNEFRSQKINLFPLSPKALLGHGVLKEYININSGVFCQRGD